MVSAVVSRTTKNDDESDEDTEPPAPQIKLNPIFEYFQLANRKVFMAFDADRIENPHVRHWIGDTN
jgi:hypothetical protein